MQNDRAEENALYGRFPATVLQDYAPISWAAYRQAHRQALRRETWNPHHDVLVERNADGTVTLLPADAMPYAWRTLWRRTP